MNNEEFISHSGEETKEFARNFAQKLKKGTVLTLYGDLGVGKTTFVQGLAEGLGIEKRIISPTFVIVRQYGIKNHELRIKNLYHIDLYRMEHLDDILELGIKELIADNESLVVIEWAEKMKEYLPQKRFDIAFETRDEDTRVFTVKTFE